MSDMRNIIDEIRSELIRNSNEKTRISGERFFKEEVRLYGLKSADVDEIGKKFYKKIPERVKDEIFGLCEELWKSGYLEESIISCQWAFNMRRYFKPEDLSTYERWIDNYVTNWASCDTFCNHTVGTLLEMYPEQVSELKNWAKSENRWMRRASAVSFIIPARKGLFHGAIFEIADILLQDEDDMVRKGYGWMLKSASQFDQKTVYEYVMKNKNNMPRTSLRYAIEKMPDGLKKSAMEKQDSITRKNRF